MLSQARLARQLKEAMAERQMAKTESKALHTQLEKLQKQVLCIRVQVCLVRPELLPATSDMT